jgi:hypothetical protein
VPKQSDNSQVAGGNMLKKNVSMSHLKANEAIHSNGSSRMKSSQSLPNYHLSADFSEFDAAHKSVNDFLHKKFDEIDVKLEGVLHEAQLGPYIDSLEMLKMGFTVEEV